MGQLFNGTAYSELQLSVTGVRTACGSGRVVNIKTRPLPQAVLTWLPCRSGYIQSQTAIEDVPSVVQAVGLCDLLCAAMKLDLP